MTSIYVLPTEEGQPPKALLTEANEDTEIGEKISGILTTWSQDMGAWTIAGVPLPQDVGKAITEHARNLGVESFC